MQRVLVISPMFPSFRSCGSNSRLAAVLEHFRARGFSIDLVVLSRRARKSKRPLDADRFYDRLHLIDTLGRDPGAGATPVLAHLCRAPRGMIGWFAPSPSSGLSILDEIGQLADWLRPSVVWLNYVHLAPLLSSIPRRPELVRLIDTHDVVHRRYASLNAEGLTDEKPMSRAAEARWLSAADAVVAIQAEERAILADMLPARRVLEVGRAVELERLSSARGTIAFVGADYSVNVHGLERFLRVAWPEIREQCPATKLELVGTIGDNGAIRNAVRSDPRIVRRGVVPTLSEIYDGPAVMVCPLWAGSGLKQKVVEALGYGKALVGTPIAAQGLEDGIDRAFLLAEQAADFIEPVVRLLRSDSQREACEAAAWTYANRKFSGPAIYRELDELLDLVVPSVRPLTAKLAHSETLVPAF